MKDARFLAWIHQRLRLLGEQPELDYMSKLRSIVGGMDASQHTPNTDVRDWDEVLDELGWDKPGDRVDKRVDKVES